jgi:hypothetical protein
MEVDEIGETFEIMIYEDKRNICSKFLIRKLKRKYYLRNLDASEKFLEN